MNGITPCRFPSSLKIALFAIVFRCFVLKSCHVGDALSAEDQHGSNRSCDAIDTAREWGIFCARTFLTDDPQSHAAGTLFGGYAHDPLTYARATFAQGARLPPEERSGH